MQKSVEAVEYSTEVMMFCHYAMEKHKEFTARPPAPPGHPVCAACHKSQPTLKRCGLCKSVRYCGPECMKRDKKAHRPTCLARRVDVSPPCFCLEVATIPCTVCGKNAFCERCHGDDEAVREHMISDCVCRFCKDRILGQESEYCRTCQHAFCKEVACQVLHAVLHEAVFCSTGTRSMLIFGVAGIMDPEVARKHFDLSKKVVVTEPGFSIEVIEDADKPPPSVGSRFKEYDFFFSIPMREPVATPPKPCAYLDELTLKRMRFIQAQLGASTSYESVLATYPDVVLAIAEQRQLKDKGLFIKRTVGGDHALEVRA